MTTILRVLPTQAELTFSDDRRGSMTIAGFGEVLVHLPRCVSSPYPVRWLFNELLFCAVARTAAVPAHPAGLAKLADGRVGLWRSRFGTNLHGNVYPEYPNRLEGTAIHRERNVAFFFSVSTPQKLAPVVPALRRILVLDQLLWMLDRTPDNMLGAIDSISSTCAEIRAVDHEHCLLLDCDPDHQPPSREHDLSRCHPTQMSLIIDDHPRIQDELLVEGTAIKAALGQERFCQHADEIANEILSFLGEDDVSKSALEEHCEGTKVLFARLHSALDERIRDFACNYVPMLRDAGQIP